MSLKELFLSLKFVANWKIFSASGEPGRFLYIIDHPVFVLKNNVFFVKI